MWRNSSSDCCCEATRGTDAAQMPPGEGEFAVRLILFRRDAGEEELHHVGVAPVRDLGLTVVLREGVEHRVQLALLLRLEFPVGVHGQAEGVFPRRPVLDLDPFERVVGEHLVHRLIGGLPVETAGHVRVALLETEFLGGHVVLPDFVSASSRRGNGRRPRRDCPPSRRARDGFPAGPTFGRSAPRRRRG